MYTCIHILFNLQYEVDTLKITILLYFYCLLYLCMYLVVFVRLFSSFVLLE